MSEFNKHGQVGRAAAKADMDRKTARKYLALGKLPSELKEARTWRTREDPFEEEWAWVQERLEAAPKLQAKTLFYELQRRHPGRYQDGQLRTLQRQVRSWRAQNGPEKTVFFAQDHFPGKLSQLDFTHASELQVTIAGQAFVHLLCNFVLVYSNWQWVTVCLSESFLAVKRGLQEALQRLGHVPEENQTDNSTAATHKVKTGRGFNANYEALMAHYGMKCRTTAVGQKEQNGDVEASNGALKRAIEQELLLRESRDFESVEAYESWLCERVTHWNQGRSERLQHELSVMKKLAARRLPDCEEMRVVVSSQSTVRVQHNAYSVPSRLIGHQVTVRIYERSLEVWHGETLQMSCERLRGRFGHHIDYRHVIWSLVKKPRAFARYRYQPDLFPTLTFRQAYDRISGDERSTRTDLEYLRVLHLAASTMESEVEEALKLLLDDGGAITSESVKDLVVPTRQSVPQVEIGKVQLETYNALLGQEASA